MARLRRTLVGEGDILRNAASDRYRIGAVRLSNLGLGTPQPNKHTQNKNKPTNILNTPKQY